MTRQHVPDGLYRLIKWEEDGNPVFPSADTVVEVRSGAVINCSTGRSWPLDALGQERSLFGPIRSPWDCTHLRRLKRFDLVRGASERGTRYTAFSSHPR